VFVLVVQTFSKNPALAEIAPTQSEPPFLLALGVHPSRLPVPRLLLNQTLPRLAEFGLSSGLLERSEQANALAGSAAATAVGGVQRTGIGYATDTDTTGVLASRSISAMDIITAIAIGSRDAQS